MLDNSSVIPIVKLLPLLMCFGERSPLLFAYLLLWLYIYIFWPSHSVIWLSINQVFQNINYGKRESHDSSSEAFCSPTDYDSRVSRLETYFCRSSSLLQNQLEHAKFMHTTTTSTWLPNSTQFMSKMTFSQSFPTSMLHAAGMTKKKSLHCWRPWTQRFPLK